MKLLILSLVFGAAEASLTRAASKDSPLQPHTPKEVTTKPQEMETEPSDKKIEEMQAHLEQVLTGLQSVAAAQKEKTKFSEILQPFMKEMSIVLTKVKTDTKLSKQQKWEMLQNAQKGVSGLAKDMSKRQQELTEESESEKESLLIGVLMAKAHSDEAEQMEVLKSDEFKNLSVVKEVLAHREAGKSLAEQVAASLDKKSGAKPGTSAKFLNKGKAVDGIVAKLQSSVDKMEQRMKLEEKEHKAGIARVKELVKKDEDKARKSNGTKAEIEAKLHRIQSGEKRMLKKAEHEYQKQHALSASDAKSLHEAISAIKKGDMSALAKAKKALSDSLKRMQGSTGDFLHFLQVSAYTSSRDGACPYCKAQCLEKCHSSGSSFVTCMGQCADVGN
eukprot:gnl/MRDRNA2_/MRDRNA2_92985_c0_seq1.p1 gnl/MRDRNA2_/MRDRNA2_92985_c0~~gnl/MRDRNA2_/MRDRNA2_92985_c0_seq1.p1  ORF type:complete len:389 (+),score=133.13 gnl/MRDRNA2_/MRDRNA2_92985_c0_seq1:100-1266(+)